MRLGGPVFDAPPGDAEAWARAHRAEGYGAAFLPIDRTAPPDLVRAFRDAAARAGIVIAEVGAWSNPMSPDPQARAEAIAHCQGQLALAEEAGARCCVNISGSFDAAQWDGPHPANLAPESFDAVVETTRAIIDAVRPRRTAYALETMPWMVPDSVDCYKRLLRAVDRPGFAVHFDPVNLVSSPRAFFANGAMIDDAFDRLGPWIRSCHGKDIVLRGQLTTHLDECRPGLGALDYRRFLRRLAELDPDTPLMLEHLPDAAEYRAAADHLRAEAAACGLAFVEPPEETTA